MIHLTVTWILLITIQFTTAIPLKNSKIAPVDLNYECVHKVGDGERLPPILLLHGMGGLMSHWGGTYEALAFKTGRRVCRADLRNHGDSPWDDEASVAAMVEDTIHLLDTIGEKTAVIIGHSLGGKIAMNAALNYPARVDSIVAEDMIPNGNPDDAQQTIEALKSVLGIMEKIPEGTDEKEALEMLISLTKELYKQRNITLSDEDLEKDRDLFTCSGGKCRWKTNFEAMVKMLETGYYSFWTESTGVYDSPALFIYGKNSLGKVDEHEDAIRKLFPKVKLVGVEGAGHLIHGLFPQFEDEVLKFLEENNTVV